jgi:hypothetical protein
MVPRAKIQPSVNYMSPVISPRNMDFGGPTTGRGELFTPTLNSNRGNITIPTGGGMNLNNYFERESVNNYPNNQNGIGPALRRFY